MYDLQIVYPGGECGAVEVATAADSASIALWNVLDPGGRWIEPGLAGGWSLGLDRSTDARRLRLELPALLRQFELEGVTSLRDRYPRHRLYDRARGLGIIRAHQSETNFPGSIYWVIDLPREQSGGYVAPSTDAVAEWVGPFLADEKRARVRRKLASSCASEHHAFIVVIGFSDLDFVITEPLMRDDPPLPSVDPILPSEVTHVWVASTWSAGAVFRWSRATGWAAFAKR
jgi:hypothetical protein